MITPTRSKVAIVAMAIALTISLFFLLPLQHLRLWICFFVIALGIGVPQIAWSTHGSAIKMERFAAWKFGWDSDQETSFAAKPVEPQPLDTAPPIRAWMNRSLYVVWFWLKNTAEFIQFFSAARLCLRAEY